MNVEEELLKTIKFVLLCNNDAQAIRLIEQYGHSRHEQALQLHKTSVSGSYNKLCSCSFHHGINCFSGNCSVCGLPKESNMVKEVSYSKEDLINAAKYGYEFHQNTSFPEQTFENCCKNNFLQHLWAENVYKKVDKRRSE